MDSHSIAIVIPSLQVGGMERVAVVLANFFAQHTSHKVHLVTFSNQGLAFPIDEKLHLHHPQFNTLQLSFFEALLKSSTYLRKTFRSIQPRHILSFGDRYNSFVVLNALGIKSKVFVSNRMNPSSSNGLIIDFLNKMVYPLSAGIVAQTDHAKQQFLKRYLHKNIVAIPNPFTIEDQVTEEKEQIVLNVGRFSDQKNQHLLVRYFNEVDTSNWELIFLGDGQKKDKTLAEIENLQHSKKVTLKGMFKDVNFYYEKASIFAFTSTSEGFPNALGEAMVAGCACISFDCEAGPSELIDDGINGFLIPVGDHEQYKQKLQLLIDDPELRKRFGEKAREKMKLFSVDRIARQYLEFMLN